MRSPIHSSGALTSSSRETVFLQLVILEVKEEVVGELQSSRTSCTNSDTDTHSGMAPVSHRVRTGTGRKMGKGEKKSSRRQKCCRSSSSSSGGGDVHRSISRFAPRTKGDEIRQETSLPGKNKHINTSTEPSTKKNKTKNGDFTDRKPGEAAAGV